MANSNRDVDRYDWIETVVKLAGYVGMNKIRVRWKLRAWHDKTINARSAMKSRAEQVVHKHKTCPKCRAINSVEDTVCFSCGAKLRSRQMEVVDRFLRHFNLGLTAETFLAFACVFVYGLQIYRGGPGQWFDPNTYDLVAMGGISPMDNRGEIIALSVATLMKTRWYTLLTCVFLHGGPIHLAFNVYSLIYIAPIARQVFNSGKVLLAFLVGGIVAALVSLYWRMEITHAPMFVGIGASGAICGVIGLMMAWGHLDGTFSDMTFRNQMGRWVFYILIYGYFLGADNAAHLGGLAAGGALALVLPTDFRRPETAAWRAVEAVSWTVVAATVGFIAFLALTVPKFAPISHP